MEHNIATIMTAANDKTAPTAELLLVDDSLSNHRVLSALLRTAGYQVRSATAGRPALQMAKESPPDLILLDINMPDLNGYEVCRQLKQHPSTKDVPVIFISADDDLQSKVDSFAVGGVDYITKPFEKKEVLLRVNTHLELHFLRQELIDKIEKLEQANQKIFELSVRDELTGLYNRRYFNEQVSALTAGANRYGRAYSVMMCDIDHFKQINDRYSHPVGDQVLRDVAALLLEHVRKADVVARYGGEEFIIAFPETSLPQATLVCEKLREAIERHPWEEIKAGLAVTLSVGVAHSVGTDHHEQVLAAADAKLYQAKHGGRNRVCS